MDYRWIILYLLINVIVFVIYGIDKWKATHHRFRIPEHTLMFAAVFGVFGAYGGMHFFHHKTQKPKFYIGVPAIFILEMAAIAAVVYFLQSGRR